MEDYSSPLRQYAFLQLSFLVVISMMVSLSQATFSVLDHKDFRAKTIVVYLHDAINATTFTIVKPVTSTSDLGLVNVAKEILTQGPSISSKQLGTWSSIDIETGRGPPHSSMLIFNTIKYDDGVFKGSIMQQGLVDFNAFTGGLAVVGGTGDFVGVRGYSVRKFIGTTVVENISYSVIQYTLHLSHRKEECYCEPKLGHTATH